MTILTDLLLKCKGIVSGRIDPPLNLEFNKFLHKVLID